MYKIVWIAVRKTKESPFWWESNEFQAVQQPLTETMAENPGLVISLNKGYVDSTELIYHCTMFLNSPEDWADFKSKLANRFDPDGVSEKFDAIRNNYCKSVNHGLVMSIFSGETPDNMELIRKFLLVVTGDQGIQIPPYPAWAERKGVTTITPRSGPDV